MATVPEFSVMIPTYNCAHFLEKTLESVLSQDMGEERMHIEVVDDYSTKDDPEEVVERLGKGRVKFYRQPQNVGIGKNFNTCITRSKGKLVHILHGDDFVLDGFYKEYAACAEQHPDAFLIYCDTMGVDESGAFMYDMGLQSTHVGVTKDVSEIMYNNRICFPSVVIRKEAFDQLGGFNQSLSHCADWEMWVRVIGKLGGIQIQKQLCCYRDSLVNDTAKVKRTADNLREYEKTFEIFASYNIGLDQELVLKRLKHVSLFQYYNFKEKGDLEAAKNNLDYYLSKASVFEKAKILIKDKIIPPGKRVSK